MRRPAKRKTSRKRPVVKTVAGAGTKGTILAERISSAPRLVDSKAAHARVADWLVGLPSVESKPLKSLLASNPTVRVLLEGLSENSPYLWELVSREPDRLLRLLRADPDQHLMDLLSAHGERVASSGSEVEAMRLLRRMKGEAALLIALADIGGVWPVMRTAR